MRAGLLGEKLGHSFSPQIHALLGNYDYALYEVAPDRLDGFLRGDAFDALNVTIPYKKAVIPYCAELTPAARAIGSVNTLVRRADGSLLGDNTDAAGFAGMVRKLNLNPRGKKALVLGSGGASLTACYVLREMGASEVVVISRSGENNYQNLERHADARVLVNTTPVGMYPNNGASPVDLDRLPALEAVLDVVYNPTRTRLMLDAEARSLPHLSGLYMLVEQARKASERFTASEIPAARTDEIFKRLRGETENLVLVGMPGSGKTTLGQRAAALAGRKFVDADAVLAEAFGMPIPDYFAGHSEAEFRAAETRVLERLGRESGLVLATGGGCVTVEANYPLLHQNGIIVCLDRALDALVTDDRPLSQRGPLRDLYTRRLPHYRRFADATVINDAAPEAVAKKIWEAYHEALDR